MIARLDQHAHSGSYFRLMFAMAMYIARWPATYLIFGVTVWPAFQNNGLARAVVLTIGTAAFVAVVGLPLIAAFSVAAFVFVTRNKKDQRANILALPMRMQGDEAWKLLTS